jgi:hypothetical protein
MEELIFFAVLIFFSIVESIARSRKKQKGGPPPEMPEAERAERPTHRPSPRPRPRMSEVPSYDDDVTSEAETSFDDVASSEEERRQRAASSESMIPADIWEEISGLAREAKVELPAPRPKPQPRPQVQLPQPRRVPQPKLPAPKLPQRPGPAAPQPRKPTAPARPPSLEGTASHPVHRSHAGYGTDPSTRARSQQDVLEPLAPAVNADASAVREQLRSQGAQGLRQAVILYEIFGPPVSSKPDRFSE